MPMPVNYLDYLSDIENLSGTMHDLNKQLKNPSPRSDWALGQIAWVYVRNLKSIAVGPITYIEQKGSAEHPFCIIRDVTPDGTDITAQTDELFSDKTELLAAMFYPIASAPSWTEEQIQDEAYRRYQLNWMASQGFSVYNLITALTNYFHGIPFDGSRSISDWERDYGFGGSLWVCKDEFLQAEYLDILFMKDILPAHMYTAYLRFRNAEAAAGKTESDVPAQPKNDGPAVSTRIEFLYRDTSNWKTPNSVYIRGPITDEQIARIMACLDVNGTFIPERVGIEAVRWNEYNPQLDHLWCQLGTCGFYPAKADPDIDVTAEELVSRFEALKGRWEDFDLQFDWMLELPDMEDSVDEGCED